MDLVTTIKSPPYKQVVKEGRERVCESSGFPVFPDGSWHHNESAVWRVSRGVERGGRELRRVQGSLFCRMGLVIRMNQT